MKLEKWALLGEIIGAIAIVISLVFVGLQVRQSNSIAATDALKEGTELWTDAYMTAVGTEESTAFFRRALSGCALLSQDEHGRFYAVLSKFLSAYDNIYNQYESGRLREEVFISIALTYYAIVRSGCAREAVTEDYINLPPWLVTPARIEVLRGREAEMRLPRFLVGENRSRLPPLKSSSSTQTPSASMETQPLRRSGARVAHFECGRAAILAGAALRHLSDVDARLFSVRLALRQCCGRVRRAMDRSQRSRPLRRAR